MSPTRDFMLRAHPGASGVFLVFALTRTRLQELRLRVGNRHFDGRFNGNVATQLFDGHRLGDDEGVVVCTVSYRGEAPFLRRIGWTGVPSISVPLPSLPEWVREFSRIDPDKKKALIESLGRGPARTLIRADRVEDEEAYTARYESSVDDVFALRERSIDEMQRIQEFFFHLDKETDEVSSDLASAVNELNPSLDTRLTERILTAIDKVPLFDEYVAGSTLKSALVDISAKFRELAENEHHLYPFNREDLVDWAFEMFATDRADVHFRDLDKDLLHATHGTPNGANYFKFSELAFTAIQHGCDADFWRRHLLSFVRTTHLFVEHAGRPPEGKATLKDGYVYEEGRVFDRDRAHELRRKYGREVPGPEEGAERIHMFCEDKFTSLAKQAFSDMSGSPRPESRDMEFAPVEIEWIAPAWLRTIRGSRRD